MRDGSSIETQVRHFSLQPPALMMPSSPPVVPSSPPRLRIDMSKPRKGFPFILPIITNSSDSEPQTHCSENTSLYETAQVVPLSVSGENTENPASEDPPSEDPLPEFDDSEESGSIHTDNYPQGQISMPQAEFVRQL